MRPVDRGEGHPDRREFERAPEALRVVTGLHARCLIEAPVGDRSRSGGDHEEPMDERPLPRMGDGRTVVVDGVRIERAHGTVVKHHVRGRQQEGKPILVEGQHHDHDEKGEVALDVPAPDVDQQGAGRDHSHRNERGGGPAPLRGEVGETSEPGHAGDVLEGVERVVALCEAEDAEADCLNHEQVQHHPVAALEDVVGERPALGKNRSNTRKDP